MSVWRGIPLLALTALGAACAGSQAAAPRGAPPRPVARVAAPPRATPDVPPPSRASAPAPDDLVARIEHGASSPCVESRLPARFVVPPTPAGPNLGRGLAIALPPETVAAGAVAARQVVVYRSYALDPRSEIGDAGYRAKIREASGTIADVSLGLSEMRPYVIQPNAKLPLLDGDTLQLAVDVREIDDASITFPPVGLEARRQAHGLMLRCPLAALERDSDGDGLTDIEEARLATDPADPDSDRDGVRDGDDPAPLGAEKPTTPADEVRAAAYAQIVERFAAGELLIDKSDGPRLDVRGVSFRLITLRPAELAAYQKRFGFRVTFHLDVKMSDADHGKVSVSFGWTGGSWAAERTPSGWKLRGGDRWVT